MKKEIVDVVDSLYLPMVLVFLILALLMGLEILSLPINYQLFAAIVALFAIPSLLWFKPSDENRYPIAPFILLVAFAFALSLRLFASSHSPVPLGYDPGFYKYAIDLYVSALPQIPEAELADWIKEMYPQGFFVLSDTMHLVAGTGAFELINYFFPFLAAFLVFPVFIVTRSMFGIRAGLLAALLYAISYTQFQTFALCYFKNVLGLMFLLLSVYALEKKKYGLLALMFAAMGIFHRPEFLLFILILVPFFILHRRRGIIMAVLGTALLIVPFWLPRLEINWGLMSATFETPSGGTFFTFNTYTIVSLAYLSFALMGAIYLVTRRNWNSILFYFVINSIIVVFELFFFRRLIVPLDIAAVILAGVGVGCTLLHIKGLKRVAALAAIILLMSTSGIPTVIAAKNVRPMLTEEQLKAVEWIKENTERDAYVLASSSDAPWALGWSERRVIAPGLFEWDSHTKDEWFSFFESKDPQVAKEFLDVYGGSIYIYYSKNQNSYLGFLEKFTGDYFQKVYDGKAAVYMYREGS